MRYTMTPVTATYSQIGKVILAIFLCSVNLPNLAFIKVINTNGITILQDLNYPKELLDLDVV